MLSLPPRLASPTLVDGKPILEVVLNLIFYLKGPSADELDALWDLYEAICPPARLASFHIDELLFWSPIGNPKLTESARAAAAQGQRRPYLEATRNRLRAGRSFTCRAWDDRELGDPEGSWSMTCAGVRRKTSGLHSFVKFLFPLSTDLDLVLRLAYDLADRFEFYSGHGGLSFTYRPVFLGSAFNQIYALAKRYWGVDIDDMDDTLPRMAKHIKGVNWITAVGTTFATAVADKIEAIAATPETKVWKAANGLVIVAGPEPNPGDQNVDPAGPAEYRIPAAALAPLFLTKHRDFPSDRFIQNGNTVGWFRRFIDAGAW